MLKNILKNTVTIQNDNVQNPADNMQYFHLGFVPDANLKIIVSSKNINKSGSVERSIEKRLETKTFINCGK